MSTGLAYFEAVQEKLIQDGLWDHLKQHLTSISTDGAANMVGEDNGFSQLLKNALERSDVFSHKCQAHQLELILKAPIKEGLCQNCKKLDINLKAISAFFHRSTKRIKSLMKYCRTHKRRSFRPRKIHDIRWVASHLHASKILYENWDTLVDFLESLESDPDFAAPSNSNKSTKNAAKRLLKVLLQVNTLSSLATYIDVQHPFTAVSEFFQVKVKSNTIHITNLEYVLCVYCYLSYVS